MVIAVNIDSLSWVPKNDTFSVTSDIFCTHVTLSVAVTLSLITEVLESKTDM